MLSLALVAVSSLAGATAGGKTRDALLFPSDKFTVETKTVKTSAGEPDESHVLPWTEE
jgi:hypothetical protein